MPDRVGPSGYRIKPAAAIAVVILLWFAYSSLQTLTVLGHINEELSAIVAFLPGILGVASLLAAGLSLQDCFLRIAPISWRGLALLAAVFVFALSVILPFGVWTGRRY